MQYQIKEMQQILFFDKYNKSNLMIKGWCAKRIN